VRGLVWLLVIGLLLAIHAVFIQAGISPVLNGAMPDSDTYMRLVRVESLIGGQDWFDSTIERMNAPEGDVLNWTRPLDVLLLAGAYPLHHWQGMEWHEALFWSGAALPVLLHILMGLAVVWAFAPLLPKGGLGPLVFLVATVQPVMLAYNMAGRPDHQTLLLIAAVMMLGHLVREQAGTHPRLRSAIEAGLWAGFGLWVSTEFQFTFVIVTGTLALLWLETGDIRLLRALEGLALGFFTLTGLAMLAERGGDWATVRELDKVSLSHTLGAAVNCGIWGFVMGQARDGGLMRRLVVLLLFGALGVLGIAFFAPELLRGPAGDIDPRVMREFFLHIREMKPLLPVDAVTVLWLGTPLLALPLWLSVQKRLPLVWMPLFVLVAAFTFAALLHARFAQFAAPLGAVLLVKAARHWNSAVARAALVIAPLLAGFALIGLYPPDKPEQADCSVAAIADELEKQPKGIVLAALNYGPELLWRTGHSVVAGPYHRNRDGILDTLDFMEKGSRSILARRGVEYVLACPADKGAFAQKLLAGEGPGWLKPVSLSLNSDFRLYRVDLGH